MPGCLFDLLSVLLLPVAAFCRFFPSRMVLQQLGEGCGGIPVQAPPDGDNMLAWAHLPSKNTWHPLRPTSTWPRLGFVFDLLSVLLPTVAAFVLSPIKERCAGRFLEVS